MTDTAGVGRGGGAPRLIVAGAINTDLVARVGEAPAAGETVTGRSFAIFGGGKGANQAVAAARSGAAVAMLGAVGADDFGRQRQADLAAEGIDATGVAVYDGEASGVALIVVEEASGQNRIAYVPGATMAVPAGAAAAELARVRPALVLATLELPPATTAALLEGAHRGGAAVVLNATPEAAGGGALLGLVDVLIVNETEAGDLLGYAVDAGGAAAAVTALTALGAKSAVITLGAAGAVVGSGGEATLIPAPEVAVVDTTGAGDAFCGAMAARLATGMGLVEAARGGVAAGSLAATKQGAQPSMPWRGEVERLLAGQ